MAENQKNNITGEEDLLKHPLSEYVNCIPSINVQALTDLLDRDIAIWTKKTDDILPASAELKTSKESKFFKLLAAKKQIMDSFVRKS